MTIHIESVAALSPAAADAMRRGVEVECAEPGCRYGSVPMGSDKDGMEHRAKCPRCQGRGRVRYHDLTRGRWVYPHHYTGIIGKADFIRGFENWIRHFCEATPESFISDQHNDYNEHNRSEHVFRCGIRGMVDAIQPGDVLVHDGTKLGQRCAEVVARVAAERGAK